MRTQSSVDEVHEIELRKEGATMALYVAVSLLAALTALPDGTREHVSMTALIWGTSAGLAVAHVFAFRVTARLVAEGHVSGGDVRASGAQLAGALAVALVATASVWLTPEDGEGEMLVLVLCGVIAVIAFAVARFGGAPTRRALVYASSVLVVGLLVVQVKNMLTGH